MRKTKKAQMQMGESIAIIIIVLILLIMGLVFYAKVKSASISQKGIISDELDIVKLSQIAYSLPEVQCSFSEVSKYGCIDLLKFQILSEIINESFEEKDKTAYLYYRQLFGTSKIILKDVSQDDVSWVLYETNRNLSDRSILRMPITIYNATNDENLFGVLVVEQHG